MLPSSSVSRVGGRETCDELEKRMMLETSLGHCCGFCRLAHFLVCQRTPLVCSNFSPARARSAATCRGRPALELDERGQFLCKSRPNTEERLVRSRPALSLRLNRQGSQTFSAPLGSWAPVAASHWTGVSNVLCTFRNIGTCRCVTTSASTTR